MVTLAHSNQFAALGVCFFHHLFHSICHLLFGLMSNLLYYFSEIVNLVYIALATENIIAMALATNQNPKVQCRIRKYAWISKIETGCYGYPCS